MPITTEALEAIKRNSDLRAKLMLVEGKSEYTIKRWIIENNDNLTMAKYVGVISEHTGLTNDEIVLLEEKSHR